MNTTAKHRTLSATQAELDSLPVYDPDLRYGEPEGYYKSVSTGPERVPMVCCFVDDPLSDYPREVWFHLEISK